MSPLGRPPMLIACRSDAEVSCVIANLLCELEQPCGKCDRDGVVLTGTSPAGSPVTIRLLENRVLEVEGGDDLLEAIRERRCPHE